VIRKKKKEGSLRLPRIDAPSLGKGKRQNRELTLWRTAKVLGKEKREGPAVMAFPFKQERGGGKRARHWPMSPFFQQIKKRGGTFFGTYHSINGGEEEKKKKFRASLSIDSFGREKDERFTLPS